MSDSILFWNSVAVEAARVDFVVAPGDAAPRPQQPGPTATSRALAITHLAMHDAFRGVMGQSTYIAHAAAAPTVNTLAAARAAVSAAACATLGVLFPNQASTFVAKHAEYLALIAATDPDLAEGLRWGLAVGQDLLAERANDNHAALNTAMYAPSNAPYRHRADPMSPAQGFLGPRWGELRPFMVPSLVDGLTIPFKEPPKADSQAYADDYNEVKAKGVREGSTRTADETTIGIFWGYDGPPSIGVPPRLYNQSVRAIAAAHGSTEAQNARLFAAVNAGMADAGVIAWHEKYLYNIWRPVVGIREADAGWGPSGAGDSNVGTAGDPDWVPLGAPRTNTAAVEGFTPGFPAYPSGHATFGTVALRIAQHVLGLQGGFAFSQVSEEFDGVNRGARGARPRHERKLTIDSAIEENILSRVYLGVHWKFDGREGERLGNLLAPLVVARLPA